MAVIGSGGEEATKEEVEGHCPSPPFFGEHGRGNLLEMQILQLHSGPTDGTGYNMWGPQGKNY